MSLTSPGVQVTINDQSQYLAAPINSVPLILLATAQNKANASGTGVATATTAANANKLYLVTSQRDLVNLYGTPFFYTTTNGTPIQGYELNEYGLLAAYSTLGVTNRAYVLRADIDLASLVGQAGRPSGDPADGTYWLDTTTSTWGIYQFNATTGQFALQSPIVITDPALILDGGPNGAPLDSIGNIGDYAVNAIQTYALPSTIVGNTYYYKTTDNVWVGLGSVEWRKSIPAILGSNAPTSLTVGDTFTIGISGLWTKTVTVPASTSNTVTGIANEINSWGYSEVSAKVVNGKLNLYSGQVSTSPTSIIIGAGSGTVLADLGIATGTYYSPVLAYGTSAQMPLWSASQSTPRPSGSVWIKVGSTGNGLTPAVSEYSSVTQSWITKHVNSYTSDWAAIYALDGTGGKAIPAGTVYGEYAYDNQYPPAPYYLWERIATGPTVVTGTVQDPVFDSTTCNGSGPYTMYITVSLPGSATVSNAYTATIPDGATATEFVTAFLAAGAPYVTASVTTDGAIQITHTQGGVVILTDFTAPNQMSCGVIEAAGFMAGDTGVSPGSIQLRVFSNINNSGATRWTTDGIGTGASFNIRMLINYLLLGNGIYTGGTGFAVGDQIVIDGEYLGGSSGVNDLELTVSTIGGSGAITGLSLTAGVPEVLYSTQLTNWVQFTYTANEGAPTATPANNTNWFYSVVNQADIMVQKNGSWIGYRNTSYDVNGHPAATGVNTTDPNGPIISNSEPTTQSDGSALVYGDLWIDTRDLENYPVMSRWQQFNGVNQWVLINNADQTSQNGITFADARWATNQYTSPTDDPIPTITSLLTSNYLDLDAPSASLSPQGMLLFNTRRSGYNVKQFRVNYFNNRSFPDQSLPDQTNAWVSVSGNQANGAAYMGRKAQRAMVVKSLRASIDTNTSIREEDNYFNLMATPNYPELQPNMVVLNYDRDETGYIIGDTPLGLPDDATAIQAWATNAAMATSTGEEGLVTRNTYLGLFYPSGIANDLSGNQVVVPPSHMMLRTFLRNDTIAYPWLAAAGTRRGNIENALNIGYLDRMTGEFITTKTRIGIRDTLYVNFINPLVFFSGVGLLNYGNKNSYNSSSALDRTNVARLVNYIRRQLTIAARPFVFEPNDAVTRSAITAVIQTLLVDLVAKRGLYDYLVQCDTVNNTPARIDRNELWVDVAIEPVKAAEFIYIPVRVLNTGAISAQVNGR
jgi:Phage tail sheath C-terminal domain